MENILHYVWKFKLYNNNLKTTDGETIEVIDVGLSNSNAGPDFFNAKVKIGDKLWAGNIEIHTSSDEWDKHNHQTNKAYNSVILHIVKSANCKVYNAEGKEIPQCEISYPKEIDANYEFLIHSNIDVPCANYMGNMDAFRLKSWMDTLLIERLERKSKDIEIFLERYSNSWDDTFYVLLTRTFGFGLNSDSFERLAHSIPLKYIQKQGDNLVQIEALLFGQAGMLECEKPLDDYHNLLCKEYDFLKGKYNLKPLDSHVFRNMRTRPSAFPQIRIAQLASLLHSSQSLFSKVTSCANVDQIRLMFHVNPSEYWQTHYTFGNTSPKKSKYLGDASLDTLLINTVAPILFAYGKYLGNEDVCERGLNFLEIINAERNSIVKYFAQLHVPINSAAHSQAIIQLKREYCEKRKCLYCRIGHQLLASK